MKILHPAFSAFGSLPLTPCDAVGIAPIAVRRSESAERRSDNVRLPDAMLDAFLDTQSAHDKAFMDFIRALSAERATQEISHG